MRHVEFLVLCALALWEPSDIHAQETREQCRNQPIAFGWMITTVRYLSTCPGQSQGPANHVTIKNLSTMPTDSLQDVCTPRMNPKPPIPPDWVVLHVRNGALLCDKPPSVFEINGYGLLRLGPTSKWVKTGVSVCSQSPVPKDWLVVARHETTDCRNQHPNPPIILGQTQILAYSGRYTKKGDRMVICGGQTPPKDWRIVANYGPGAICLGQGTTLIERTLDAPTPLPPPSTPGPMPPSDPKVHRPGSSVGSNL